MPFEQTFASACRGERCFLWIEQSSNLEVIHTCLNSTETMSSTEFIKFNLICYLHWHAYLRPYFEPGILKSLSRGRDSHCTLLDTHHFCGIWPGLRPRLRAQDIQWQQQLVLTIRNTHWQHFSICSTCFLWMPPWPVVRQTPEEEVRGCGFWMFLVSNSRALELNHVHQV